MSGTSLLSSRLHRTTMLLKPYVEAMWSIRSRGGRSASRDEVKSLLDALVPLDRHLRGIFHFIPCINESSWSEILRQRHSGDWQAVRDGIVSATAALEVASGNGNGSGSGRVDIRDEDMPILGYVGEALEYECASIFAEMRGR